MTSQNDERIQALAKSLNRDPKQVCIDIENIKAIRANPKIAYNKFFTVGGAWLHHELNEFQDGVVTRLMEGHEKQCEILPRGHTKTTLVGRIWTILQATFFPENPYIMIFSLGQDNYHSNLNAVYNAFTSPQFASLQWLAAYYHGENIATKQGAIIRMGSGAKIEFKSLLSEARGANDAEAEGRPKLIILDDIIPTEAAWSSTMRKRIEDRYLSMVRPMGADGCQFIMTGTTVDRDDIIGKVSRGVWTGWEVTPPEHRKAFDKHTKAVLFPERYTYEDLQDIQKEYDELNKGYLFGREYLNDTSEVESYPLSSYKVPIADWTTVNPLAMHRVISIDHAHGAGRDYFVALELGQKGYKSYILQMQRSNTWRLHERYEAVLRMLTTRKPQLLAIEDTSESRSFIEGLTEWLAQKGVYIKTERPSASARGNKEQFIHGQLEPRLQQQAIIAGSAEIAKVLHSELAGFNLEARDNLDDTIDCLASGVRFLKEPDVDITDKPARTGNHLIDDINDVIYNGTTKEKQINVLNGGW